MRNIRFAGILVLIAVLMSMALSANAAGSGPTIRVNETFDGEVVFLDQNWGLTGGWTANDEFGESLPITRGNRSLKSYQASYIPAINPVDGKVSVTLGLSLAYIDGASTTSDTQVEGDIDPETGEEIDVPVWTPTTREFAKQGVVSTERAFSGTKSMKLDGVTGTDVLSLTDMDEAGINNQPWFHQFMLAAGSTQGMPAGTVIGGFKMNFKTIDVWRAGSMEKLADVDRVVALDAVTDANGDLDLVLKTGVGNTLTAKKTIGKISPSLGSWANLSFMTKLDVSLTPTSSTPTPNNWGAFDGLSVPGTTLTKGPVDMFHGRQTTTSLYYSGVTVFCNSKTKSAYLSPLDIDPTGFWGTKNNDLPTTSGKRVAQNTTMVGWQIWTKTAGTVPEPGVLYVDDILWGFPPSGRASYQDPNGAGNYIGQEMAARMHEFTENRGVEDVDAAVKVWNVY